MARRTKTIEVEEELFTRKETIPVRLEPGQAPYTIWNCPADPYEKIRVNDTTILRFRDGVLECRDASDDEMVAAANKYAGGKYIRADEDLLSKPIEYTHKGRTTRWYSRKAYERYVALNPNVI
jgi:hypothetical protein